MTDKVIRDLKMAEISLAKVRDVVNMEKEAVALLSDFRVSIEVKDQVADALNQIENASDYQITPKIAAEVDGLINSKADIVVKDGSISVSGTEAFGLSMLPAEWRRTRITVLKQMLAETHKNIKRWANQLSDNFQSRWVELTTSTEVLESRLESLQATLDAVFTIGEGMDTVELNELLSRSISKDGKVLTGDLSKQLQREINYILSCLKLWEMHQIRFKNAVIRYFGNVRNTDITIIERDLPKLFDQRGKLDDRGQEGMLFAQDSRPMLDGYRMQGIAILPKWIKDNIKGPEDNTTYADTLSLTGYELLRNEGYKVSKTTMPTLRYQQILSIRDLVVMIIERLKVMNLETDPVNFNPEDVKDVLSTLRAADAEESRAYQYGLITSDYQFNVNAFKTQVTTMLIVLANHYITMLNQHLENYTVE